MEAVSQDMNKHRQKGPPRKRWNDAARKWLAIAAGNALLAFLVTAFAIPHSIIMSGTTGIALAIGKLTHLEDISRVVLTMNVILLLFGRAVLGREFFFSTVASSLLYPMFLALMRRIPGIDTLTDDPLLAVLYTGALLGVSLGLVMRVGASTGGTDVVNLVMQKWTRWPLSVCVWITDILILLAQAAFSGGGAILYGIAVVALETLVLDRVMILGKSQIQLLVITDQFETIRAKLLSELQAGVTMLMIETGYMGQRKKGVLCVIPPRKLFSAKEMIYRADPSAFLTITQIREVNGQGFNMDRQYGNDRDALSKIPAKNSG